MVALRYGIFYLRYGGGCQAVRESLYCGSGFVVLRYGRSKNKALKSTGPYFKSRPIPAGSLSSMKRQGVTAFATFRAWPYRVSNGEDANDPPYLKAKMPQLLL